MNQIAAMNGLTTDVFCLSVSCKVQVSRPCTNWFRFRFRFRYRFRCRFRCGCSGQACLGAASCPYYVRSKT